MDQLYDTFDKLGTEFDHLERLLGRDDLTPEGISLALSVAKRVRVKSSLLVKCLAALRDETATSP
jgi:hypothetical protein